MEENQESKTLTQKVREREEQEKLAKTDEEMINWYNNWINKEPDKYFA